MFTGQYERENRLTLAQFQDLRRAELVGTCIPIQTNMNVLEIEAAKGFPAQFASWWSRNRENIPQVLWNKVR